MAWVIVSDCGKRYLSYPDDFWPGIHWGSWDAT